MQYNKPISIEYSFYFLLNKLVLFFEPLSKFDRLEFINSGSANSGSAGVLLLVGLEESTWSLPSSARVACGKEVVFWGIPGIISANE